MTGLIRRGSLAVVLVIAASACTPSQMAQWMRTHDQPVPKSHTKLVAYADVATRYWDGVYAKSHPRLAAPAAAPSGSYGYPWDQLVRCEATGRWNANTGNGYYGGLQFNQSTWLSYGGGAYASRADLASPPAQIAVAQRVIASAGGSYRAWPACRSHLGLP